VTVVRAEAADRLASGTLRYVAEPWDESGKPECGADVADTSASVAIADALVDMRGAGRSR
jgi:hypothetical protein